MDEKDWALMKILYEEKSITRAAERLYISQPALSYRLKHLEEAFDTRLFYKRKRGIEFTAEGEYLAKYAEQMMEELQRTKDHISNIGQAVKGTLRIGVSSNFAQYRLPDILKRFSKIYPDVQFKVNTGWSTKIMSLLDASSIHVGVLRGDYHWRGDKFLLTKERLCLISRSEVNLENLPELPLIHYKTDTSLDNLITAWWHDNFASPPSVAMEVDRQETCKEMVKHGLGFGIVPEICLQPSDNLFVKGLSYKNNEPVLRDTWLMYHPDSLNLAVAKAFIDFLNQEPSTAL